jgi:uncharacterized DUF497 family protein
MNENNNEIDYITESLCKHRGNMIDMDHTTTTTTTQCLDNTKNYPPIQVSDTNNNNNGHNQHIQRINHRTTNNNHQIITTTTNDNRFDCNNQSEQDNTSNDGRFDIDDSQSHNNDQIDNDDTKRDTKCVANLKVLVILILVISATIISVVVYRYITQSEKNQFEDNFHSNAKKVFEEIGSNFDRTLGALNAISIALVSYAHKQGDEWPYVTIPDFALLAAKLLPLTEGVYIAVMPIVQPNQKDDWEEYAYQNDYWVNETLAIQNEWDSYYGEVQYNWERNKKIYGSFGDVEANVRYDFTVHIILLCNNSYLILHFFCLLHVQKPVYAPTMAKLSSRITSSK